MSYISIIYTACLVFPILAFLITLPYTIYNYNKYGSVLFIRTLLIYLFVLYLLSAYFLIIMPLPKIEYVKKLTTEVQLVPFYIIKNMIRSVNFDISNIHTYINVLKNPFVYQSIYNLLLMVPFGMFLRYYFKCNLKKTFIFTFLLSLFFELTQLTGLYFIYPNAYRLFDVDDIITNTLGGILGYLIVPIFYKILPTKEDLDLNSYKKGMKVSSTKRLITFIIDLTFSSITFILIHIITYLYNIKLSHIYEALISLVIIFVIIPIILKDATLGQKITNLKIVNNDDNKAKWYQVIIRELIMSLVYIPFYYYLYLLFNYINIISNNNYYILIVIGYISTVFLITIFIFIRNFILHKRFLYEIITKTKIKSTIKMPDE